MRPELLITSSLKRELNDLLESIFIFEGRIDFLKNKHKDGIDSSHDSLAKHREPHAIIDHFATNADPSKKKVYTQKIVDWYKNKDFRQEDHGRVRQTLKDFEANKKKLPHSDIGKYKSFHHLNSALADFKPKQTNLKWGEFSQSDIDHISGKGATTVHDEPKYTVRKVHDQRAMDILGKDSEWCTVSNKHRRTPQDGVGDDSSYFDDYKKQGDFFHIHDKATGERFLSHAASNQHMDIDDFHADDTIAKKYGKGLSKSLNSQIDGTTEQRREVAESPFANKKQLDYLSQDDDDMVRFHVSSHDNTHHETLHKLKDDLDTDVLSQVANHRNTRPDTLDHLSRDNRDFIVQSDVVSNSNTAHSTLTRLVGSSASLNPMVRKSLAKSERLHPDALHTLHKDPDPYVRRNLAHNPNARHDTLHKLHNDAESDVRYNVAHNPNTRGHTLHAMEQHKDRETRHAIALHKNATPETLHALHTDRDYEVRNSVGRNPNTRPDTLHALHRDPINTVKRGIARNPNSSHETLRALHTHLETSEWSGLKNDIANNPSTPPDILHALHKDTSANVRSGVASNPSTHPDILHTLHKDGDLMVRLQVSKNTSTHHETLHGMRNDPDFEVRGDLTYNSNTRDDTLHALRRDPSASVRASARLNLMKRGLL